MKSICIAGDSWGCGEWDKQPKKLLISHKGVEQFLQDEGFEVTNLSREGGSNIKDSLNSLLNVDLNKFDLILLFQTEPIRDYKIINFKYLFESVDKLLYFQNLATDIFYKRLNNLDKPIYLMGGCSKIKLDLISNYHNLKVFIPSIPEFLIPNFQHPEVYLSFLLENVNNKFPYELIDYLLNQEKLWDFINFENEVAKYYFYPDRHHPNRNGHYEIFKKIKKELLV